MHSPIVSRLASVVEAFSSAFSSAFGGGGTNPVGKNTAHGELAWRLSLNATARTRAPRDIAGTLKNELTASQTTLSQLTTMLTTRSARTQASALQKQISAAQTTLSQLTSILPP
jgi:hypothetical protein